MTAVDIQKETRSCPNGWRRSQSRSVETVRSQMSRRRREKKVAPGILAAFLSKDLLSTRLCSELQMLLRIETVKADFHAMIRHPIWI